MAPASTSRVSDSAPGPKDALACAAQSRATSPGASDSSQLFTPAEKRITATASEQSVATASKQPEVSKKSQPVVDASTTVAGSKRVRPPFGDFDIVDGMYQTSIGGKNRQDDRDVDKTECESVWKGPARNRKLDAEESAMFIQRSAASYPRYLPCDEEKQVSMDVVYNGDCALRGSHRRNFNAKGNVKIGSRRSGDAAVLFNDLATQPLSGWPGQYWKESEEDRANWATDPRILKVELRGDTQRPALLLHIKRGVNMSKDATCLIYPRAMVKTNNKVELDFSRPVPDQDGNLDGDLPKHERIKTLASTCCLWRIDVKLEYGDDNYIWTGLDETDLKTIEQDYDHPPAQLDDSQKLIGRLLRARNLSFFLQIKSASVDLSDLFAEYFYAITYATKSMGAYWWYRLHDLDSEGKIKGELQGDFKFEKVRWPRWMIQEFEVRRSKKNNKLIDVLESQVAEFLSYPADEQPDAESTVKESKKQKPDALVKRGGENRTSDFVAGAANKKKRGGNGGKGGGG